MKKITDNNSVDNNERVIAASENCTNEQCVVAQLKTAENLKLRKQLTFVPHTTKVAEGA